jgi:uncharacterized protein YjiS (DUF1127 family)
MRKTFARAAIAAATIMLSAGRVRRNIRMLHELSDAQLKDIGLARFDIEHVARAARRSLSG